MSNHYTDPNLPLCNDNEEFALAVVNFVENGEPVKGARVTIRPVEIPKVDLALTFIASQTIELVTDAWGHAEVPLVCGSVVEVSVDNRGAVKTIRVPDMDAFELVTYPPVQ